MPITLDKTEQIQILEEIARDGRNRAAQIAALTKLEEMRGDDNDAPEGFEGLYAVGSNGRKAA